jgi:putative peptide zinc metalloprotease protein
MATKPDDPRTEELEEVTRPLGSPQPHAPATGLGEDPDAVVEEADTTELKPPAEAAEPPAQAPSPATAAGTPAVPRLATDIELIGIFEDSGFKEPPYIARRSDGQIIQLAPMLYALAEEIDGQRDTAQIAEALSERMQRGIDAGMVEMLLDEQLRRLGIVAMQDGDTGEMQKIDPLLALKFRTKVVPQPVIRALTTVFKPLFLPPVMLVVVAAFAVLVGWLFGVHGISQSLRAVLYQPALRFMLLGGVVLATAFHEIGHATAVRYGGARPGVMGVGIYIVWPAFYTDITDAYRLPKWGRLRADIGGMYFNCIFGLAAAGLYLVTDFEPLLLLVVLQTFAIVQQAMPFLRLDGYYIVSDLTGVPDILSRIKPVLSSLLPWRKADDRVTELKPWVRVVVTGYIVILVPVLAGLLILMLVHAPRMFATAYDSLNHRWDRVSGGEGTGQTLKDAFQMIVLALPCVGLTYTTSRIVHRTGLGAWRWSDGHPGRRVPLLVGSVASLAIVVMLWWPRGDYRPITRDERGTVLTGLSSLPQVARERIRVSPPKADTEPEGDGARTTTTESGVTTTTPTTTQTVPATETVPTTTEPLPAEDPAAPVDPAAPAPADPTLTETVPVAP